MRACSYFDCVFLYGGGGLQMFKEFFCSLPLPTHYRNYLLQSTHFVSTRNPTVSQLLQNDIRYDNVDDMKRAASQPCHCATLAQRLNIPLVQGHLFIGHAVFLRQVFGVDSRVLLQHRNNDVCPTRHSVRKSLVQSAGDVLVKVLPECVGDKQATNLYPLPFPVHASAGEHNTS